jgi:hypothetical protein
MNLKSGLEVRPFCRDSSKQDGKGTGTVTEFSINLPDSLVMLDIKTTTPLDHKGQEASNFFTNPD